MSGQESRVAEASGELSVSDFVEWDVENWSRALDFWMSVLPEFGKKSLEGLRVLEVGARDGGLTLWLASQGAHVVSTDLQGPTDIAKRKHQAAGLADRIEYRALDATAIPEKEFYDVVAFKSVLGGVGHDGSLERQLLALKQMHEALKPGGVLLFAENLRASPLHRLARRAFVKWGRRWRYPTVRELESGIAEFSNIRTFCFGFLAAFGRSESARNRLGRLDRLIVDRLVPPSWRYVMAAVARK